MNLSWDHTGAGGVQTQHSWGLIMLVALVFLIAVRHGFRPHV
jgi:hypothetical protein